MGITLKGVLPALEKCIWEGIPTLWLRPFAFAEMHQFLSSSGKPEIQIQS